MPDGGVARTQAPRRRRGRVTTVIGSPPTRWNRTPSRSVSGTLCMARGSPTASPATFTRALPSTRARPPHRVGPETGRIAGVLKCAALILFLVLSFACNNPADCLTCEGPTKPCGNGCIAHDLTCEKPSGCARQGASHYVPVPVPVASPACCTRCTHGKPCGDTCIPASSTCHTSGGCAC